ncbi:sortase A [Arthrobacter alpinus]|uniref:Sortase A n=1 Tax=Arthrobacter alpinus TaxID=656366 RepID=A0A1H5PGG9_9MICC|nr:class C sortase [Arthrobacter alpinus]SEF12979.1 sortase A [Arthrobacter alpinus]
MQRTGTTPRRRQHREGRWGFQRILIILIAVIGVGILLYPAAAAWSSARIHDTEISGYAESVKSLEPTAQQKLLAQTRDYNAELPAGPLRDPYSLNEKGEQEAIGSGSAAYKEIISLGPEGMMGNISIPSIKTNLPIFHGTGEDSQSKGVGHLFGSSLPAGGTSTHSVLTAHSGYVSSALFDSLKKVVTGDVFSVTVLDETIYYKVDQIKTILPEETDDLRQVKGKDYITLITCTPTGVNTHRLLVRGERIPAPVASESANQTMANNSTGPGFPWWAVIFIGTTAAAIIVTHPKGRRVRGRKHQARSS